jgi:hypothetical protein
MNGKKIIRTMKDELLAKISQEYDPVLSGEIAVSLEGIEDPGIEAETDPLNSQLGLHRILRTSPLTEVPPVCCKTECE